MIHWTVIANSPSKSFAACAIAFCVGVAAAALVPAPQVATVGTALTACMAIGAVAAVFYASRPIRVAALCVFLLATGAYRAMAPPLGSPAGDPHAPAPIAAVVENLLLVRTAVVDQLGQIIPEPHAAFLSGLIFGGSSELPKDLRDEFRRTGMSHILAASGSNVSLFSTVFLGWLLTTPLGRRRSLIITAVVLVAYVIAAGGTAAVVRAALMASVGLIGAWIRRAPSIPNALLLAGAIMLFFEPTLFWDVGFELSFAATIGVLWVAPKWKDRFDFIPETLELRTSFATSLAAIVLTTPIVLIHFGTVSLVAPIANLLILPLLPFLMAVTFAALLASILSLQLGTLVALPAFAASSVVLHLVHWLGTLPFASISPAFTLTLITLTTLFALYALWRSARPAAKNAR